MNLETGTNGYWGEGARVPLGRGLQPALQLTCGQREVQLQGEICPCPQSALWPAARCCRELGCWKMQRGLSRVRTTAFEGHTDPRSGVCRRTKGNLNQQKKKPSETGDSS